MDNDPTLQQHIPLVNFLSTQCVSSDKSEDDTRCTINYPHVYLCWWSRQLVNVLYKADTVAAANAFIPISKCKKAGTQLRSRLSEPVPPMNSDMSRDKCKGLLMTGRGDAEVLMTWLQCMCCALVIPVSSYFGGLKDRVMEVQQRLELPEGRGDRGEQRGVHRKYSRWYSNWGTIPSACRVLILYIRYV